MRLVQESSGFSFSEDGRRKRGYWGEFRPSGDQRIPLDRSRSGTCTEPAAPALRAAFFIFSNIFFSYWNVFLFEEEVV